MTTRPTSIVKLATVNPDFLRRVLLLGAVSGAGTGLVQTLLKQRKAILDDEEEDLAPVGIPEEADATKLAAGAVDNLMSLGTGAASLGNRALSYFGDSAKALGQATGLSGAASSNAVAQSGFPDEKLSMLDYALAGTGGPLAFLLSLGATRGLYNKFERHELKQQMRDEQEALLQALEREAQQKKYAAGERQAPDKMDLSLLALLGVLGLTGVTAGVLTDQTLTSQFPAARSKPRPARVLTPMNAKVDGGDSEDDTEAFGKLASELLIHTALSLEEGSGDVTDVVKAAAIGLMPDVTNQLVERGVDAAFGLCEAAQADLKDPLVKFAAVRAALNAPIGPSLEKVAASVFAARCPSAVKQGAAVNKHPSFADQFVKLAGMMVTTMLWAADVEAAEKSAGAQASEDEQQAAFDLLEGRPLKDAMNSGDSSSLVNATATTSHGARDSARGESDVRRSSDPIDQIISGDSRVGRPDQRRPQGQS